MTGEYHTACDMTAIKNKLQHQELTAAAAAAAASSTSTFMTCDTNNDHDSRQLDDDTDDKEMIKGTMPEARLAKAVTRAQPTQSPSPLSNVDSSSKQQGSDCQAERTEDTDVLEFYSSTYSQLTHTTFVLDQNTLQNDAGNSVESKFRSTTLRSSNLENFQSMIVGSGDEESALYSDDGEQDEDQSQGNEFDLSPGEEPSEYVPPIAAKGNILGVAETLEVEPHKTGINSATSGRLDEITDGLSCRKDATLSSWGANFWCIIEQPNGKSFFANPQTGECAWAVPSGTFVLPPRPQGQWWQLFDDEHRLCYYFHTKTKASQWERPSGFVIPLAAIQESTMGKRFSRTELKRESITRKDLDQLQSRGPPPQPPTHAPFDATSQSFYRMNDNWTEESLERSRSQIESTQVQERETWNLHRRNRHRLATGLSTIPSSTNLLSPSPKSTDTSKGKLSCSQRPHTSKGTQKTLSSDEVFANPSRKNSLDIESYSSSESPTLFRRERDPVKRRLLHAKQDDSIKQTNIGSPIVHHTSSIQPRAGPIFINQKRSVSLTGCEHSSTTRTGQNHSFSFETFAANTFAIQRVGIFRRKCPLDRLVRWQKQPLRNSLLSLDSNDLRKDAIRFFKIILRYCEDRVNPVFWPRVPFSPTVEGDTGSSRLHTSNKINNEGCHFLSRLQHSASSADLKSHSGPKKIEEVRWMLDRALANASLGDELFAQLMKQMTDNANDTSWNKAWTLLCICLTFVLPSKAFQASLGKFVKQAGQSERIQQYPEVGKMVAYCLRRLEHNTGYSFRTIKIVDVQAAEKAAVDPQVFGDSLINIMSRETRDNPEARVPRVLSFLQEELLKRDCFSTAGIFRTPGDPDLIQALRRRLNQGNYSLDGLFYSEDQDQSQDSRDEENHVLASTLKLWLRELQEPLIPGHLYNACLKASQCSSELGEIYAKLDPNHLCALFFVVSFLQLFCSPEVIAKTLMSAEAIVLIFVPILFRSPSQTLEVQSTNIFYEKQVVERLLRESSHSMLDDPIYPLYSRQLYSGCLSDERQVSGQHNWGIGENDGGLTPRSRKASSVMRS